MEVGGAVIKSSVSSQELYGLGMPAYMQKFAIQITLNRPSTQKSVDLGPTNIASAALTTELLFQVCTKEQILTIVG